MAPRTSATFAKRQKERARQEKQQAKQERRMQRRLEKRESPPDSEAGVADSSMDAEPLSPTTTAASESAPTEKE